MSTTYATTYASRFTTVPSVEEEITLLRNNWDGTDHVSYDTLMRALHNRRKHLLSLRGALLSTGR